MNITYNSESPANNMVTFTDIPNILKFDDNSGSSAKATISLTFAGNLRSATTYEGQWEIVIMGETITSTLDAAKATNKNFYVSTNAESTAVSVAKALRNCPSINAAFTVAYENYEVELKTRTPMYINPTVTTTIPNTYLNIGKYTGVSPSSYEGATISVDVISGNEYITTLEKKMYGGETAFDLSPVLTTLAKVGEAIPYSFSLYAVMNGEYSQLLNNIGTNYITVGYMVNQGLKYIPSLTGIELAANVGRGTERGITNNTVLYIYQPSIPLSFYTSSASVNITVKYLDSALNELETEDITWENTNLSQKLKDLYGNNEITLNSTYFNQAFYIDVYIGTSIHLRYNVIKPLKATEYVQRVYWRNSYGGISFFDFTGQRTESRNFEVATYNTNIFDYYDNPKNELEKIYNVDVDYVVTMKSHLIENDAKYLFNDLIQSSEIWTEINGEKYGIILNDVTVDEQNNNNIYEATIKYRYSQKPSLI